LGNFLQDRIQGYSPTWATPILANSSQNNRIIAKVVNETVPGWHAPVEWFIDEVLPVAYQAVPKEWVAFQDIEIFIAPIYDLKPGIGHLEMLFGRDLSGQRMATRENPGGFIMKYAGGNALTPDIDRTLENPGGFIMKYAGGRTQASQ
jgi:hypothetical protein